MLQLYIIRGTFHPLKPGNFFHIESNNEKNATLFLFPPKSRGLMPTSAGPQGLLKQALKRPNNNCAVRRLEERKKNNNKREGIYLKPPPAAAAARPGEAALGAVTL